MGTRRGAVAVAVAVGIVAGVTGCRSGDGGGDDEAGPADRSVVMMERLGCEYGFFQHQRHGEWDAVDARQCWEGPFIGNVYGSLTEAQARTAVRSLTEDGPPHGIALWCDQTNGGEEDLFVVTGDGWVAVIAGEDDADTVADRLEGTRHDDPLPPEALVDAAPGCVPGPPEATDGDAGEHASEDGAGGGDDRTDARAATEPSPSGVLAERMGCDSGYFERRPDDGWQGADVHDCYGEPTVEVYASLTDSQRDAATRLLAMQADVVAPPGAGGCAEAEDYDEHRYLVAGDTWVAVVRLENTARTVARELDGRLQPGTLHTNLGSVDVTSCYSDP